MNITHGDEKPAVLTCWKDIANYMGKGVRTVQRWEQEFGLPVRRPLGSNKKAVLARPADLDAWVALRCGSRIQQPAQQNGTSGNRGQVVAHLSALCAQIETSRQLRRNIRSLLQEFQTTVDSLYQQISYMHGHTGQ